jgi:hypothetical protein
MTRKAIVIWKAAMSNLDPAPPPCPPDFAAPAWTNLVFGGAHCEVCLAPNVSERQISVFPCVHRTARRPMCTKSHSIYVGGCALAASRKSQSHNDVPMKSFHYFFFALRRLVYSSKFSKLFPEYEEEILDLIPYTQGN